MKKILSSILIAVVAITACNNKNADLVTEGELSFAVESLADDFNVVTKANDNIDEFSVSIRRPRDNWQMDFIYGEKKGEMIKLGSGDYVITAASPVKQHAAWDLPVYEGAKEFSIVSGQVTPVNLVCELSNVKVTFVLSENFKKELSTYNVTVSNGKGELTWIKEGTTDDFAMEKAGFFTAAPLDITVTGYRAIDDTEATTFMTIMNVSPKDHHIINLDAKVTGHIGDGQGNGIKLEISTDVNEKNEDVYVDGLDEIPVQGGEDSGEEGEDSGEGQPSTDTKPSMVWPANPDFIPLELEMSMTATVDVELVIRAPEKIKEFLIYVKSDVLSPTISQMVGEDYKMDKDGITTMDMINDPDLYDQLGKPDETTGEPSAIPMGDRILDQTEVPFSLSTLVPLINVYVASITEGDEHTFTLYLKDGKGQELTQAVTFISVKPKAQ